MSGQAQAVARHTISEVGKNGNPLVVKGVERIESINLAGDDIRRDAKLYTHVISRVMRRDFNLTSVKLFWYAKAYNRRQLARRMLCDLTAEAQRLEDLARRYELPDAAPAATCIMRIISDEADLLFDALITADRALHKLMHSPLAEVAEDHMSPYLRSLTVLRKEVFGFQGDRRQRSSGQDSYD
jgi:hypothetical protein